MQDGVFCFSNFKERPRMTRHHLVSVFFIILLLGIFWEAVIIFSPFLPVIFWAALLAFGFYPLYEYFLRRFHGREDPAAVLTVFCILMAAVPLVFIVLFNMSAQVTELLQKGMDYAASGRLKEIFQNIHSMPLVRYFETKIHASALLQENLHEWTVNFMKSLAGFMLRQLGVITKNILFFVLGFLASIFLAYAFLKHGKKLYQFVYELTPLEEADKEVVFRQIRETLSAVIRGQILTAIAQAICAGAVFYVLALPAPLLIAAATFLSSMIPVVGASMVWFPFVVYLVLKQQFIKALILFLLGTFVISAIDNFLKPAIIGEKTKLPYFLLFLSILGGMSAYGFLGLFLAPVIMSLFFVLIKIYREKYFIKA